MVPPVAALLCSLLGVGCAAPKAAAAVSIELKGLLDTEAAARFVKAADAAKGDVVIHIDTKGGNLDAGAEIAAAIARAGSRGLVTCVVDQDALSAGFYVLQACPVRVAKASACLMAHEPYYRAKTYFRPNDAITVAVAKGLLENLELGVQIYTLGSGYRLKGGVAGLRERLKKGDWYMQPVEALSVGAVDIVLPGDARPCPQP